MQIREIQIDISILSEWYRSHTDTSTNVGISSIDISIDQPTPSCFPPCGFFVYK